MSTLCEQYSAVMLEMGTASNVNSGDIGVEFLCSGDIC